MIALETTLDGLLTILTDEEHCPAEASTTAPPFVS